MATEFTGELWTVNDRARDQFGLQWVLGTKDGGLALDPVRINTGKHSGFQAVNLAFLFGAARITLLGYDYSTDGTKKHWHGDHPLPLGNGGAYRYGDWMREMELLAHGMRRQPCKLLNASRKTALRCIQRVTLEIALNDEV